MIPPPPPGPTRAGRLFLSSALWALVIVVIGFFWGARHSTEWAGGNDHAPRPGGDNLFAASDTPATTTVVVDSKLAPKTKDEVPAEVEGRHAEEVLLAAGPAVDEDSEAPSVPTAPVAPSAPPQAVRWENLYERGLRMREAGDLDAAVEYLSAAAKANPNSAQIAYELGYALQKRGLDTPAIEQYRRAIELRPEHGFTNYNLGYLLQKAGDLNGAAEYLIRASAALPDYAFVHFELARISERRGDRTRAIDMYRRILDMPNEPGLKADARVRLEALAAGSEG